MNSFAHYSSDRVHSLSLSREPVSAPALFPAPDSADFALNIITVLMMYGPFYLANTGAMLFGSDSYKFGFSVAD